jgi:hypothetical protein
MLRLDRIALTYNFVILVCFHEKRYLDRKLQLSMEITQYNLKRQDFN